MHRRVLAGVLCLLPCSLTAAPQSSSLPTSPTAAISGTASPDPSTPLPDIETLLARVRARSDALESLRKSYVCTMTQVADEFSANGSKKTHTDVYQAFYVANTEVLQHISRDGKPLSSEDTKKEQERVDKLVAKLKSQESKPSKDDIHLTSALLKVGTFTNPRREVLNGRPTLVFDYKGNPHSPAANLGEEIMRESAGTLWVDERDSSIVRLNGALQENFRVGGGLLVNVKKGSSFDFIQALVNGEIWFPSQLTSHFDGRFLLFKGFDGNARDTFSDYRKLKTSITILPGTKVVTDSADSSAAPPSSEPGTAQPATPPHP